MTGNVTIRYLPDKTGEQLELQRWVSKGLFNTKKSTNTYTPEI